MLVRALLDLLYRKRELLHLRNKLHILKRLDLVALVASHDHHLPVLKVVNLLCTLDNRRCIRCKYVLVFADAHDERRAIARTDKEVGFIRGDDSQPESPFHLGERLSHRFLQRHPLLLANVIDQMRDELCVGV
jgi:hypothetical protein